MKKITFEPGETNIVCSDINRSLAFYRDILGFEKVEDEGGAIRMRLGGSVCLLLPIAEPAERNFAYGSVPTFSLDLLVNDIAETVDYLESRGVKILKPIRDNEKWIVICDPDGLPLEIIEK